MAVTKDIHEHEQQQDNSLERYRQVKEQMKHELMQEFEKDGEQKANVKSLDDVLESSY